MSFLLSENGGFHDAVVNFFDFKPHD